MIVCNAAEAGFDEARLIKLTNHLQSKYVDAGRLAHVQFLLSRDERPVVEYWSGDARADGTALQTDSLFRIASMTKPITTVAAMMLWEEGLLALEDPVTKYLPEFERLGVYAGGDAETGFSTTPLQRPMQVIDLMRHTSGLTYGLQQRTPADAVYRQFDLDAFQQQRDADAFIAALSEIPLEFQPGEWWNYSVSTDVLGVIVQRIAGMPLHQFYAERIFSPLGMIDTAFDIAPDKTARLTDAWQFARGKGKTLFDRGAHSRWRKLAPLQSGGGGLISSAADYHRFCRMLLRGGELDGARLLSPSTLQLMTRNHISGGRDLATASQSMFSESSNSGVGFGLGFAVTMDPGAAMSNGTAGDFYWGGVFSTFFFIDPVEKLIAILMTQLMPSSVYPIRRELKTMIYSALVDRRGGSRIYGN